MDKITQFYHLEAWKKAHLIVLKIYKETQRFPKEEIYGIVSQLRRASSSISANISEGFNRYHFKDKTRFYYQARGSVGEVQNFIILSKDLKLITNNKCVDLIKETERIKSLINGLINSINYKLTR